MTSSRSTGAARWRAGAARVELTPPAGTHLAGDIGRHRPAEIVLDPLYARALVLESNGRRICLLSLDLTAVSTACARQLRDLAAAEADCDHDAVMVHDTQTHGAPALGHFMLSDACRLVPPEMDWLRGGDRAYETFALERIVQAVRQAAAHLQPVSVAAASGTEGRVAFNRRFIMRDGRAATHPAAGSPLIRYAEGPVDPELGLIALRTDDLRLVALLLHHTCHPCHGYPHRFVTADWPGAWCHRLEQAYPGVVPLVLNGCCGNIHHANHLDPRHDDSTARMADCLTETTLGLLRDLRFEREAALDWRSRSVAVPWRELLPDQLAAAQALLAEWPRPRPRAGEPAAVEWEWCFAAALLDLAEQQRQDPAFMAQVQAFRLGQAAVVGLPGEPFVEGQLQLKLASPAWPTYVAHHCNTLTGYIPTVEAIARGGYEAESCGSRKLVPEALDLLVEEGVRALREMF